MHAGGYRVLTTLSATFFAAVALNAAAQSPEYDYRNLSEYFTDESRPVLEADSSVFYRAVQATEDIFADIADYSLSFVSFNRRGGSFYSRKTLLNGIPLRPEYRSMPALMKIDGRCYSGLRRSERYAGSVDGFREYETYESDLQPSCSVSADFADRNYTGGLRGYMSRPLGRDWSMSAFASLRTGRDLHVDGVFSNSAALGALFVKRWNYDTALSLTAMYSPSQRGLRRFSTAEAFTLTGDNLYNPSWGYQAGKMRNANVRRTSVPSLTASFETPVTANTHLRISAGLDAGVTRYSSLEWFDALTPAPDNYRYLPSYYEDADVAADVARVWRSGNPLYTQINWDELYEQNRMAADGHSVYAVADRVQRITDVHLVADAVTDVGNLTIGYGLRASHSRRRNYRAMRDLLGGDHIVDIDRYLVDDATFRNMLQNDMRHPDRTVREGDRFDYDYAASDSYCGVSFTLSRYRDRSRLDFAAEVGDETVRRRGYFEKELFPGSESYGRSGKIELTPYTIKAGYGYSFTARNYIELCAAVAGRMPEAEDLFLQTQYNNRIIDNPRLQTVAAGELNYTFLHRVADLRVSLFAVMKFDGCEVSHYYDDLASEYSDMVVSDIDMVNFGAEISAIIRLARHWQASLAVTAGRYTYKSDPRVTIYADSDNRLLCDRAVAHMGDCHAGSVPSVASTAEIMYRNKGWGIRLGAGYAGLRYADPQPVRRTDRISRQGSVSPEDFSRFVTQERLPDAVTVDAAVWKTFRLKRDSVGRMVVSLSVYNVLNNRNIIYDARESARVRRTYAGGGYIYSPFPTTYMYSYPRTVRFSVSYRF